MITDEQYMSSMLPGYADTDTDTRYGDTLIHYFSKNKDTGIRQYIYKNKNKYKFQELEYEKIEVPGTIMRHKLIYSYVL